MSKDIKEQCPEFPFFGAKYPDARCIDGRLYDLDKCDDQGNLYEMGEYWPCPFCQTEKFIKHYAEYSGMKYKDVRAKAKELKAKHAPAIDKETLKQKQ